MMPIPIPATLANTGERVLIVHIEGSIAICVVNVGEPFLEVDLGLLLMGYYPSAWPTMWLMEQAAAEALPGG